MEQKIVVLVELNPSDHNLILNGIKIATIFEKELCLVYNSSKKNRQKHKELKTKLQQYTVPIKNEIPGLKVSTLFCSNNALDLPDMLSDDYEAIFMVVNSLRYKRYLKILAESAIPMLFVHPDSKIMDYNHIVQPIDLRKENSDSSLWCTYFGRFNKSEIVVVVANDKSKQNKRILGYNVEQARKLYRKFEIKHKVYRGTKSSFKNSFEALDLALASESNLLVILGSSAVTPLDLLIGLPERKIIQLAGKLPVLLINPRKDNYILCD